MWGFLTFVVLIVSIGLYCAYDEAKRGPPEVRESAYRQEVADSMPEVCVKGVVYYSTTGPHNVRLAPAVDEQTLQFKRCK